MNTKQLTDKLVSWIKERVSEAGCMGVTIGMSGGLDSSVGAVLCQYAFPNNTLGVIMPCCGIEEDETHALAVASKFSIPTRLVRLDDIYYGLLGTLSDKQNKAENNRLAQANLKARLRMITLYYFANRMNYLVVGSSNHSELSIGYFTKYGDGGVDIMPLGNLVKKQVVELAKFLNIPQEIIDKPPSAGLWEGQTDEDEMGFSYDELDRYILRGEAPADTRKKIESMLYSSAHKRVMPPIPDF